ncbi:MAG: hypothetical protein GWM90_21765 [Gemmatimonadetes bacterium]|nr:hypothetical protein [Gemmatimonadota bacterium]NIQ57699.1 hypothetical protein [Gemmatimonadota bacterium]NIU77866.1 hypothetical protein [Gammaproteobacteria bacterium]NIX46613.1 hypothetical protein [Gemmatimonadota bacterium]NIY11340.1 hypothetical protein [Gemmatimonadota bacterium]
MTGERKWPHLEADGVEWEVRVVPGSDGMEASQEPGQEVIEFVCLDGSRRVRQVAVPAGAIREMDEVALRTAYRKARPIGGDHYGRPGKRPVDAP